MQIYLIKDLKGHGRAGEIITVNDGYGRNFIIKNGIGRVVDNAILSQVKSKQESNNFHREEDISAIKDVIKNLEEVKVTIKSKVGANGKMFGSVTSAEVGAELLKLGFNIEKKNIVMDNIKEPGIYKAKAKFNYSLGGEFIVEVINDN